MSDHVLYVLQESELSEDNTPQKPLCVVRAELDHHRRLAYNDVQETGPHERRFCKQPTSSSAFKLPSKLWKLTLLPSSRPGELQAADFRPPVPAEL